MNEYIFHKNGFGMTTRSSKMADKTEAFWLGFLLGVLFELIIIIIFKLIGIIK